MTIENWQSLHPEKQGVTTYTLLMILKDVEVTKTSVAVGVNLDLKRVEEV